MDRIPNRTNRLNEREQFLRIANARLRKTYGFMPQRVAVAARMWRDYLERKSNATL